MRGILCYTPANTSQLCPRKCCKSAFFRCSVLAGFVPHSGTERAQRIGLTPRQPRTRNRGLTSRGAVRHAKSTAYPPILAEGSPGKNACQAVAPLGTPACPRVAPPGTRKKVNTDYLPGVLLVQMPLPLPRYFANEQAVGRPPLLTAEVRRRQTCFCYKRPPTRDLQVRCKRHP